jgi:hypothetical protein
MIDGQRHRLKTAVGALLACDELWSNRLTEEILEAARNELDGYRETLDDKSARYDQASADRAHFFLLRDLIVSAMTSDLLVAWAREGERP